MEPSAGIASYFAAMRRGAQAEDELMAPFTTDATYTEPFTNRDEPAIGRDAIRDRFRQGWKTPLPDLELDVLTVEISGSAAVSNWECRSSALPGPVRGEDRYEFDAEGLINKLDVRILPPPD